MGHPVRIQGCSHGLGMTALSIAPTQPMGLRGPRDPAVVEGDPSRHLVFSPGVSVARAACLSTEL